MSATMIEKLRGMPPLGDASSEEIAAESAKAVGLPVEDEDGDEDAKIAQREYTFQFRFEGFEEGRKKVWQGAFTDRILTIAQGQQVSVMSATYAAGLAREAIGENQASLNDAVAHMTVSLTAKPPWAKDLRALENADLIVAIYREVMAHNAAFRGLRLDQTKSGEGAAGQPGADSALVV